MRFQYHKDVFFLFVLLDPSNKGSPPLSPDVVASPLDDHDVSLAVRLVLVVVVHIRQGCLAFDT